MLPKEHGEEERLLCADGSSASEDEGPLIYELDTWEEDGGISQRTPIQKSRWWTGRNAGQRRRIQQHFRWHTKPALRHRSLACHLLYLIALVPVVIGCIIVFCGVFFPSYSYPPELYLELRDRVRELNETANVFDEKIFIAASLYDHEGELVSGEWGKAVLELVDILGKDNVFLSIYENDPDEKAQAALDEFAEDLPCESATVTEELDLHDFPHIATPDGSQRVKRISFLADVRNRALQPLEDVDSPAYGIRFDKLLYLNDVVFDPIDAANLLFSTNIDEETGRTQYKAACAMDFINPFKFYDTYASRDIEGYEMGIPFYPWFAADTQSRTDIIEQRDAVEVKSCWGGMVAFEAKWFQRSFDDEREPSSTTNSSSLRFRASTDTYWDGSECCFIHADLAALSPTTNTHNTGIYMNPYIRVAYSSSVLPWLSFTKRFERLYTPIHSILNYLISKPSFNPRRLQQPGEEVTDRVWVWDEASQEKLREGGSAKGLRGKFEEVRRTALPGGFCGLRKLSYINEDAEEGEKRYITVKAPAVD